MKPDGEKREEAHRLITLETAGRGRLVLLCLFRKTDAGEPSYYVLAECEGKPLRWRSMIKDNAVRRLRDELVSSITREEEVDRLDVETIFFCSMEAYTA